MDEILASIRKILNEDEAKHTPSAVTPALASALTPEVPLAAPRTDDVLMLDETMLVHPGPGHEAPAQLAAQPEPVRPEPAQPEPAHPIPARALAAAGTPLDAPSPMMHPAPPPDGPPVPAMPAAATPPVPPPAAAPPVLDAPTPAFTPIPIPSPQADPAPGLVGPAAAGAASASVETLMRTLARERATATHRGGPTIEDLVREEMRPMLKHWLDTHLPPLVERLVRAEIERVVNRITP